MSVGSFTIVAAALANDHAKRELRQIFLAACLRKNIFRYVKIVF